jgi:hypothetical protein
MGKLNGKSQYREDTTPDHAAYADRDGTPVSH